MKYPATVILVLLSLSTLLAQDQYHVHRKSGEFIFDGVSDEEMWASIDPIEPVTITPVEGNPPSERTEFRMAFDDDNLYVSGRFYYKDLSKLMNSSKKRDVIVGNSDWMGVIIDSFNDKENALAFWTTPSGLRTDIAVFNDAQGDFPMNVDWNTFWNTKSIINDEGWFIETVIPFSSLRFQVVDDKVTMGIILIRYIAGLNESSNYPAIPYRWGGWSNWKPSQAKRIVFEGLQSRKPLYIAPYVLGGVQQLNELNDTETQYDLENDIQLEAGLDVKYGLSENFTMDLTLNTDFAQVEADDQQVNLTRFSLFFPEKRLFFQERSSVFDFRLGGPFNRLFYSRRIGIFEGEPVNIYGGARVIGRAGDWDIGFLDMQTAPLEIPEDSVDIPTTNYGVFRIRKQVGKSNSYIGGMLTNKMSHEAWNRGLGLDAVINLFGDDYLSLAWSQTFDSDSGQSVASIDNVKMRVNLEKRAVTGFGYNLSFSRTGEEYNPEMGFELRQDVTRYGSFIRWGWITEAHPRLLNHELRWWTSYFVRNFDQSIQSSEMGPVWNLNMKNSSFISLGLKRFYEDIDEEFEFDDNAVVPVGDYTFYGAEIQHSTSFSKPIVFPTNFYLGTFYDGTRLSAGINPQWNVSSSLELSAGYQYSYIDFGDRNQSFEAHLVNFRSLVMISTKLSMSTFLQYNSVDNIFIGNFRLRYNPAEGNDLFIVYNEGINTNRHREIPTLPTTETRTIVLKYTYTFNL